MPSLKKIQITLAAFLLAVVLAGCSGPGVYHKVGKGETLWRISKTYGVDIQDVAELNNIKHLTEIKTGRLLYIPGVSRLKKVNVYVPPKSKGAPVENALKEGDSVQPIDAAGELEGSIAVQNNRFIWPVDGKVISSFGMRNGTKHGGIDIKAPEGVPIKAAESGTVAYLDSDMRGYGKIVILKHEDEYFTVYAHNKENFVQMGDKVEKGQLIATVGATGNATTSHLHFEVRHGKTVRNPLFFLPSN
ncbi:MAG: M23 family metallopeptidase [Deltaproteobacteria bacterium]|nr:M23 family metallopeptidase [Deltaproteobacteria bacterium]